MLFVFHNTFSIIQKESCPDGFSCQFSQLKQGIYLIWLKHYKVISCDWHEKSCRIYFHATAFSHAFATFPVFKWCWYSKTFDVFLLQTHDLQNGNVRLQNPTVFCFRSASLCSLCYHVTCLRASQNAMFFHGQALYGLLVNFHYI